MPAKIVVCNRSYSCYERDYWPPSSTITEGKAEQIIKWNNTRVTDSNFREYWEDIIRHGGDATTGLNGFKRKLRVSEVTARWRHPGQGFLCDRTGYWTAQGNSYLNVHPPFPDNLYQEALSKAESAFVSQIKDARHVWAAGEPLGDIAQAVRLLVKPLKSLEALTINAGRGTARIAERLAGADKASQRLKACTDSYLAFVFGAKPLYEDIQAAKLEIHHLTYGSAPHGVIRLIGTGNASQSSKIAGVQNFDFGYLNANPSAVRDIYITEKVSTRILGGYRGESRSPELAFWDSAGLAPSDWIPTLYELFPWSFALDYFTNVGSALEALCLGEVDFAWLQQTDRYTYTFSSTGIRPGPGQDANYQHCYGGEISDEQITVVRKHRSNSFESHLRFRLPGNQQSLNLAALANSLLSSRNRCHNP